MTEFDLIAVNPGTLVVFQESVRSIILGNHRNHWILPKGTMASYLGFENQRHIFGCDEAVYEIIEPESLSFELAATYTEAIRVGGKPEAKPYRVLRIKWKIQSPLPIQGFMSKTLEDELAKIITEDHRRSRSRKSENQEVTVLFSKASFVGASKPKPVVKATKKHVPIPAKPVRPKIAQKRAVVLLEKAKKPIKQKKAKPPSSVKKPVDVKRKKVGRPSKEEVNSRERARVAAENLAKEELIAQQKAFAGSVLPNLLVPLYKVGDRIRQIDSVVVSERRKGYVERQDIDNPQSVFVRWDDGCRFWTGATCIEANPEKTKKRRISKKALKQADEASYE